MSTSSTDFVASQAGVAMATLSVEGNALSFFGYMQHTHVLGVNARRVPLQCLVNGAGWLNATDLVEIPASVTETDPKVGGLEEYIGARLRAGNLRSTIRRVRRDLSGVRFACAFDSGITLRPGTDVTVRLGSSKSDTVWTVGPLLIQCPGFPLVAAVSREGVCEQSLHERHQLQEHEERRHGISLSVCLPVFVGAGYSARTIAEYLAWYALLGATRVVVFESIEPENELQVSGPVRAERARSNLDALNALASRSNGLLHIVRGLASWEMMRRTANKDFGQSLAGNICKSATGNLPAIAEHPRGARPAPYVLIVDMDEYLAPPLAEVSAGGFKGALARLARALHAGHTITGLYNDDPQSEPAVRSAGTGRCLVFASVYYMPSQMCGHGANDKPAVVRLDRRMQPDKFEAGPSYHWQVMTQWNFMQRSKYLTSADDATMVGVHECCCTRTRSGGQCLREGGSGMPRGADSTIRACASVEHVPLEFWEVRHAKYGLRNDSASACTRGLKAANVTPSNTRGRWEKVAGTHSPLPLEWTRAFQHKVKSLLGDR